MQCTYVCSGIETLNAHKVQNKGSLSKSALNKDKDLDIGAKAVWWSGV